MEGKYTHIVSVKDKIVGRLRDPAHKDVTWGEFLR